MYSTNIDSIKCPHCNHVYDEPDEKIYYIWKDIVTNCERCGQKFSYHCDEVVVYFSNKVET